MRGADRAENGATFWVSSGDSGLGSGLFWSFYVRVFRVPALVWALGGLEVGWSCIVVCLLVVFCSVSGVCVGTAVIVIVTATVPYCTVSLLGKCKSRYHSLHLKEIPVTSWSLGLWTLVTL